jgi:hypothetical protein
LDSIDILNRQHSSLLGGRKSYDKKVLNDGTQLQRLLKKVFLQFSEAQIR